MGNPEQIFPYFFALFALIGGGAFIFFRISKNIALKSVVWRVLNIGGAFLFLGVAWAMGAAPAILAAMSVFLIASCYLNLRGVKFCPSCAENLFELGPFAKPDYCPKCGVNLVVGNESKK